MRLPVRMVEKEEENLEEVRGIVSEAVGELSAYLEGYFPEKPSYSKHSIMGPVGKLISVLESGRFENKDALLGYVINIHNNTAKYNISAEGIEHLKNALDKLEELRNRVNVRTWLRMLRDIDYAVYKNKLEYIVMKGEEKGGDGNGDA